MTAAEAAEAAAGEAAAAAGLRKPIRDDCLTLGLGPDVGPGDEEGVNAAVAVAAAGSGLTEEEGWAGGVEALLGRWWREDVIPRFPGAAWPNKGAKSSLQQLWHSPYEEPVSEATCTKHQTLNGNENGNGCDPGNGNGNGNGNPHKHRSYGTFLMSHSRGSLGITRGSVITIILIKRQLMMQLEGLQTAHN